MLTASLAGALLHAGATRLASTTALIVALAAVLGAAATFRLVRRSVPLQLVAASCLACAGVPVEVAGGISMPNVAVAAIMRASVFVASVLLARGALAASGKSGRPKSAALELAAVALAGVAAVGLGAAEHFAEAAGCLLAAGALALLASRRPTAKDLKPLGLWLSALVTLSALVPLLS